jgi:DNA-binding MarR family transcriptional regulator/N-acetylglutamate synthase-like GNAT family acetyltransferase
MQGQSTTSLDRRIAEVRAFNRFYTRRIGVVREGYLQTRFSLTEARVLYELAQVDGLTATQIGTDLDPDPGYLSRMLRRFEDEGLLTRGPSAGDKRQHTLTLTPAGRAAFAPLDERSRLETGAMLAALPEPAQEAVVSGMVDIARMLSDQQDRGWFSRSHAPGDIGWVIERHGALYAEEYNFNHKFEALVAQVAGSFLDEHDPARERCWIAERNGVRVGSVFLVRKTDDIGKLRLLLVEPSARGLGVGKRLVADCIAFARQAGYRRMTLWTNDILVAARGIYQAAGFRIVSTEPHSDFGPPMVGEEWEREL